MLSLPSTLTHDHANACLRQLQAGLAKLPAGGVAVVEASSLTVFDSSALAVLLEGRRMALAAGKTLQIQGAPTAITSLARLYGVDNLLHVQTSQPAA